MAEHTWYGARHGGGSVCAWTIRETKARVWIALESVLREPAGTECSRKQIKDAGWRVVPVNVAWRDG